MQNTRINKLLDFLKEDGEDPFILYALATEYNNNNEKDLALSYYLKLIADHPNYVGTYYHLGKFYEDQQNVDQAIVIYQQGMKIARDKREMHAFSELQGAYNKAAGLDYEDD